ncbi:hypothetical protein SUGI_0092120 [Cryptomeria japonica]|nr:hypothetical protein SUGI_0092120 [Cryptomeria japonica]
MAAAQVPTQIKMNDPAFMPKIRSDERSGGPSPLPPISSQMETSLLTAVKGSISTHFFEKGDFPAGSYGSCLCCSSRCLLGALETALCASKQRVELVLRI